MAKPQPSPAKTPPSEDDYVPGGGPRPPKAPDSHPAEGAEVPGSQGTEAPGSQGADEQGQQPAQTSGSDPQEAPGLQGTEAPGRLTSADRPKLGARVDPWIKQTLKIAAALERRKEEALVEQALTAYLWQHHPRLAAQVQAEHEASRTH